MEVGNNIRKLRLQMGLTQKELAYACGLSNGMISKVENSVAVPALGTLMRIAEVLNVKVSTLMQADEGSETLMTINPFADPSRFLTTVLGYRIFSPAADRLDKRIQAVLVYARQGEVKPHLLSHEGDEFIFIFEGEMVFVVGRESHLLRRGDSLYFSAGQKHGIASVASEVKYLDIFVGASADGADLALDSAGAAPGGALDII